MELFEYVFFTLWLTLWLSQDVQSLLCYRRLQPWILATFSISAILIKFPCGLRNEAIKFVYKQDNFVYEQGNRRQLVQFWHKGWWLLKNLSCKENQFLNEAICTFNWLYQRIYLLLNRNNCQAGTCVGQESIFSAKGHEVEPKDLCVQDLASALLFLSSTK